MKTDSEVNFSRAQAHLRSRFNPLRNLTPQSLSTQLDDFRRGYLCRVAQTFEIIEARDDILRTVASKRKRAAGRHGFEILTVDDSPAADKQREVLEDFWNNITVTHGLDGNLRGGWGDLTRQMLDAVGKKWAVHELIYSVKGGRLLCEFKFVPLWFFENETGKLRYLPSEGATAGEDLEEDGWMVTCGDGLMEASSVNYMFKRLPLQDWLGYSEKHGFPWPHLETTAAYGSEEWNSAVDTLSGFLNDGAMVTSQGQTLTLHEAKGSGPDVFEKLVERCDRANAAVWRGSDLSTMSADNKGASVQGDESDLLAEDDALLIENTLTAHVSRFVLRYHFGDAEPLAYLHVNTPVKSGDKDEMEIWAAAADRGVPLSITDFRERFNLATPEDGDELLLATGAAVAAVVEENPAADIEAANAERSVQIRAEAVNEDLMQSAKDRIDAAFISNHRTVADRFKDLLKIEDAVEFRKQLAALQSDLPNYISLPESPLARAFEDVFGTAAINGAAEGQATQTEITPDEK